jgi:hypothetical protein
MSAFDNSGDRVQRHLKALKFLGMPQCIEWLDKPASPSDDEDPELEALREIVDILRKPTKKTSKAEAVFHAETGEVWDGDVPSDGTASP